MRGIKSRNTVDIHGCFDDPEHHQHPHHQSKSFEEGHSHRSIDPDKRSHRQTALDNEWDRLENIRPLLNITKVNFVIQLFSHWRLQ